MATSTSIDALEQLTNTRKDYKEMFLKILLDNLGRPVPGGEFLKYTHRSAADIEGLRKQGWIIQSKMNVVTNVADYTLLSPHKAQPNSTKEGKQETMRGLVRSYLVEEFNRVCLESDPALQTLVEALWSISHKANTSIKKWTPERLVLQSKLWKILIRAGHSPHYIDYDENGEWVMAYQSATTSSFKIKQFHESRLAKNV